MRPGTKTKSKRFALSVAVPTEDLSYPVLVGAGLLARAGAEIRRAAPAAKRVALISDDNVMALYGERLREGLQAESFEVLPITIPAGEASKTPERLLTAIEAMVSGRLGRRDIVVALGGGVVGDLAGLTAALFMRGVDWFQVPTSLLAQVDASVGGKVAVDLPSGKNLLGAFHFPSLVLIDPSALQTLDDRQLGCGLAEMIKHGALFSQDHFDAVIQSADSVYARDTDVLARLVAASVALKAACVARDPREQSVVGKGRVVLNLGHTIGHALEAASNFELAHGEAVALGLRAAARLSDRKGITTPECRPLEPTIVAALDRLRLPTDLDKWLTGPRSSAVEGALAHDKKRGFSSLTYIALARIGEPAVLPITPTELVALLRAPPSA